MIRNNSSIWRLAEWFHDCVGQFYDQHLPLRSLSESFKNNLYDEAAELLKLQAMNHFTTPEDNHSD